MGQLSTRRKHTPRPGQTHSKAADYHRLLLGLRKCANRQWDGGGYGVTRVGSHESRLITGAETRCNRVNDVPACLMQDDIANGVKVKAVGCQRSAHTIGYFPRGKIEDGSTVHCKLAIVANPN